MAIDHTYYGLAMREYTLFIATEVQLPLGRSVIISNGNNMLLKYIRIQYNLLQNLFVVLQNY